MSLFNMGGRPVHIPADSKKFAFDREVSAIFEDMAVRSIPNFTQAHLAHARMLTPFIEPLPRVSVLDVGASRGSFFRALQLEQPYKWMTQQFDLHAVDNSEFMCDYLRHDYPQAAVRHLDVASPEFLNDRTTFDVVCAHYVVQFVSPQVQIPVLLALMRKVKPGGVFIFGHKSQHYGHTGDVAHEEYLRFRVNNGYSREEIEKKTAALKGSMFPMDHNNLMTILKSNFTEVMETYRFMMFSTLFAVK